MGATGITAVRDAAIAKVLAAWTTRTADDTVSGPARADKKLWKARGRGVYVFRSERADQPATRDEDQHDYTLVVWVIEKYPDAGDPPDEWVDERVNWVEWLLDLLGDPRGERLLATAGDPASGLWPESAALTTVYDVEDLTEHKAFSSVITVTYREQTVEG